jgi:hypothetical protein
LDKDVAIRISNELGKIARQNRSKQTVWYIFAQSFI